MKSVQNLNVNEWANFTTYNIPMNIELLHIFKWKRWDHHVTYILLFE